jgi:pimeloyl-ACP methyl ester carboxylesterase
MSLPVGVAFGQNSRIESGAGSASVAVSGEVNDCLRTPEQEAAAAQNPSLPIVFVPGTAGSELRITSEGQNGKYNDDLYWLGLSTLKNKGIMAGELDESGNDKGNKVSAKNALTAFSVSFAGWIKRTVKANLGYAPSSYDIDVYANFLSWANRTFGKRFYVAPYDWRKGAGKESFELIDKVVARALCETKQTKVILLAHSLGGLVSRDYVVRSGGKNVAALIAVGTPWLGAPKAARALLWGYNFDIGIVKESNKKKKIKDLPPEFVTDVCANSRCESLNRTSFLKREEVRELSKNFPGVYIQLPTEEFMNKYGSYYGPGFRSIIWGMNSWDAVESFYRDKNNAKLYDEAKAWRAENLNGKDYNVNHYLIGGVYNPACKTKSTADPEETKELKETCDIGNRMDMQMPQESQVPRPSRLRRISVSFWDAIASIIKSDAYDDSFVALDSAYEWGDGTSPLLSATAGAYVRGGQKPSLSEAERYLGKKTEVTALTLGSRYGHSAMLNDPQIKRRLVEIYRAENDKLNPEIVEAGEDIHSILIILNARDNRFKHELVTRFMGAELLEPQKTHFLNSTEVQIAFKNPKIQDSELVAPKERDKNKVFYVGRVYRNLRTTDLKDKSISLRRQNDSSNELVITGVTFVINGKKYSAAASNFPLTVSKKDRTIPIPAL